MTLDALDGVAVAPDNHKVIFESEEVRVLETTIIPGEVTPLHTHLAPTLMYVVSSSHFIRRDDAVFRIDAEAHDREHRNRRSRCHRRRAQESSRRVSYRPTT